MWNVALICDTIKTIREKWITIVNLIFILNYNIVNMKLRADFRK